MRKSCETKSCQPVITTENLLNHLEDFLPDTATALKSFVFHILVSGIEFPFLEVE